MKWFFRFFFRTLRAALGPLLLLWDRLTSPTGVVRPPDEQQAVDAASRNLALYQFRMCPFCIKTRRAIKRLSLNVELRDAQHDAVHREALLTGGGQVQVPCLRIAEDDGRVTWMYESAEIIGYLDRRFAP